MTRIRNGKIVREKDAGKSRELGRVLVLCVLFSVPLFFYVWEQVTHYQIGQQIQQMERQRAVLEEEGRKLDLERARLCALGRVDTIARESLGMVEGRPVEMIALENAGRRPVQFVAQAAPAPSGD